MKKILYGKIAKNLGVFILWITLIAFFGSIIFDVYTITKFEYFDNMNKTSFYETTTFEKEINDIVAGLSEEEQIRKNYSNPKELKANDTVCIIYDFEGNVVLEITYEQIPELFYKYKKSGIVEDNYYSIEDLSNGFVFVDNFGNEYVTDNPSFISISKYEYMDAFMKYAINNMDEDGNILFGQFSEDALIVYNNENYIVYGESDQMFYSSESGLWYSLPDQIYFLEDNAVTNEYDQTLSQLGISISELNGNSIYEGSNELSYSQQQLESNKEDFLNISSSFFRYEDVLNGVFRDFSAYCTYMDSIGNEEFSYLIVEGSTSSYGNAGISNINNCDDCYYFDIAKGKFTNNNEDINMTRDLQTALEDIIGENGKVYLGFNENNYIQQDYNFYSDYIKYVPFTIIIALISGIISVFMICYLFKATGRNSKNDEKQIFMFDKVFVEIQLAAVALATLIYMYSIDEIYVSNVRIELCILTVISSIEYFIIISVVLSFVRKIKAQKFLNSIIIYRIFVLVKDKIKLIMDNGKLSTIAIAKFVGYSFVNSCMLFFMGVFFYDNQWIGVILLFILWFSLNLCLMFYLVFDSICMDKIIEGTKKIAEGEIDYQVSTKAMVGDKKKLGDTINSIGTGLNQAIEKSVKDERLKAQLITNVSHDIKTPLTSIITYIDLLKREKLEGDRVNHYLEVLDSKSQRLKQLTENLVEASKVTTGNIELTRVPLNLGELLNQTIGEFEDKLCEKKLTVVSKITKEPTTIYADGRRTFRVLDNIFQNIYKYAMSNTRVYVELENQNNKIILSVKNISERALNITPLELTERFIRGDESRNTEGSGLGLSIAKDLVKMQDGQLDIFLDGDLFKIIIEFPYYELVTKKTMDNIEEKSANEINENKEKISEEIEVTDKEKVSEKIEVTDKEKAGKEF